MVDTYPRSPKSDKNKEQIRLSSETTDLLCQAWEVRTANFPMEITSVRPINTVPVSISGEHCALNCAHCGKHYLKGMQSLESALEGDIPPEREPQSRPPLRTQSYLISGGCTPQGKVPLVPALSKLEQLSETSRLNVHPGLVSKEEAMALSRVANVASFDFVGNRDVIQKVYGLNKDVSDYLQSYRNLVDSFGIDRVVPHVTIGLLEGRISNEAEAVSLLASEGISKLALLVFRPTPGTQYEKIPPPNLEEVAAVIAKIRTIIPTVPIYLGCMRPGGSYRNLLDKLAVQCGLNKIVQPASSFEAAAKEHNLKIIFEEECCSL